jgi:ribonuclease VapC
MIVVDTSAIVSVMFKESGYERIMDTIARSDACIVSPVTFIEATMVMSRAINDSKAAMTMYMQQLSISLCAIDERQAELAQHAFLTYGKGRHPARLNLGDCFVYAAAKALDAPLLFIGEDFTKTDIARA